MSMLFIALFTATVIYTLWAATVGWNTSLMQMHSFRQTQTAISSYFIAQGGPILKYETPTLGPPWSIPFEFPLYQTIVAGVHKILGCSLEAAGRGTARAFFYLSLLPLLLLAWQFGVRGAALLLPLTLFLLSPLYLFWSRQFMIESTATFFGLSYLALSYRWLGKQSSGLWASALLFGLTAALVKSTSYACYAMAVGLLFAWEFWKYQKRDLPWLVRAGLLLLLPLAAGVAWAKFTDFQKMQNPLAGFITSASLFEWNFGTLAQRLSGDFWMKLFRQTIHDSIGHRTGWMLSVALALAWGRKAALYWVFSALFLAAPLIFTNLHIIHNYYANANGVFLVLAIAVICLQSIHSDKKWAQVAGLVLFLAVSYYSVREFVRQPYWEQQVVNKAPVELGAKVAEVVAPEEVILVYGWDWDSTVPYFAKRRAIMARNVNWDSPELKKSFELLAAEGKQIGAVIFCNGAENNESLTGNQHVGKFLFKHLCAVYDWRN